MKLTFVSRFAVKFIERALCLFPRANRAAACAGDRGRADIARDAGERGSGGAHRGSDAERERNAAGTYVHGADCLLGAEAGKGRVRCRNAPHAGVGVAERGTEAAQR